MKNRHGFTLVELMVSMALIIFIMAILSHAFIAALGVFRNLKGQGDLAENLRSAAQTLQRDLAADHFDGNRRLSDLNFWSNGPPSQGFFQIIHGTPSLSGGPANFIEGYDLDSLPPAVGIGSYRSTDHKLSFTVKMRGNNIGDFLTASAAGSGNIWDPITLTPLVPELPGNPAPPGPINGLGIGAIKTFGPQESRWQPIYGSPSVSGYNYQWGSVAWFMMPQINPGTAVQDMTDLDPETGSPPVPLYTLYRRQALLVPDNNLVTLSTNPVGGVLNSHIGFFPEMSCWTGANNVYFNSPSDITVPTRRLWGNTLPYTPQGGALTGSDIQLNDVISFDVRILFGLPAGLTNIDNGVVTTTDQFVTLWQAPFNLPNTTPGGWNNGNTTYYPGAMVFDTWSSVSDSLSDYSQWNAAGLGMSIPLWNGVTGPLIKAIQITIRIWDFKTSQTRQLTIVQAM